MFALQRNDLIGIVSPKQVPNKVGKFQPIEFVLDLVEEDHWELVDVHLLEDFYHGFAGVKDGTGEELGVDGRALAAH